MQAVVLTFHPPTTGYRLRRMTSQAHIPTPTAFCGVSLRGLLILTRL